MKRDDATRRLRPALMALWAVVLGATPALAQPTQEEVFKSIGDSVNEPVDSSKLVAVLASVAGVVVLLVVVSHGRGREPRSKSLNHSGKLLKEVLRNVPLKSAEVKQIKALSQDLRTRGGGRVESALTLLLCPSLLAEAAKQSRGKADLPVVAGLVKRLVGK